MKTIWKGSIAFGLVNIPVQVYSAIESAPLGFTVLHEKCLTPVKYHRWCPQCEKEVTWDQTVKGIKKSTGNYLVLDQEQIKALRPEKTNMLSIVEFAPLDAINVLYFNKHYYVAPAKQAEHAYALFIQALKKQQVAAVGQFVMRDKQYVALLHPYDTYLLLTTLHYAYEIRGLEKTAFTKAIKVTSQELSLAEAFIKQLSVKKFDITLFKDTFAQQIKKLMLAKTKKRKVSIKPEKPKIIKSSLASNLRASLENISQRPAAYAKRRK